MCAISGFLNRRADVRGADLVGIARAMPQTPRHRGLDESTNPSRRASASRGLRGGGS